MKNLNTRNNRSRRNRFRTISVAVVILAIAAIAVSAVVVSRQQAKTVTAGQSGKVTENSPANRVGRSFVAQDPSTQVRPLTQDEAQKLAEALKQLANRSTEGLVQVTQSDGSVRENLEGRFQNVAVARKKVDGSAVQACVDNPEAGAAFFGIDPKLVGVEGSRKPELLISKQSDRDKAAKGVRQ